MTRSDPALVALAAANLAAWHRSSVHALGWPDRAGGGWWTCPLPGPTIYHAAISLRPDARARRLRALLDADSGRYVSVCDSFGDLDLRPFGLDHHADGSWFHRAPGPIDAAPLPDLSISRVTDKEELARFEATVGAAFQVPILIARFDIHAPGILDDPAMTCVLGSVDDVPVAVAMAYETIDLLGVYGVGTVPAHRGRGYATALMRRLLAMNPTKPTVLQPTAMARSLYGRLGFSDVGRFAHWI